MLWRLNIRQKICQFFQCILRIANLTPDIPRDVSSSGNYLSFALVPGRQVWYWSLLVVCWGRWVFSCAVAFRWNLHRSNLNWGKNWLGLAAPWCWWSWVVESNLWVQRNKDNGPGGQQAAPSTCVLLELLSQTRGPALDCKAWFSSQLWCCGTPADSPAVILRVTPRKA